MNAVLSAMSVVEAHGLAKLVEGAWVGPATATDLRIMRNMAAVYQYAALVDELDWLMLVSADRQRVWETGL